MKHLRNLFLLSTLFVVGAFFAFSSSDCLAAIAGGQNSLPWGVKKYTLDGTAKELPITQIRKIEAGASWKIVLTQGSQVSVRLEYDEDIASKLIVAEKNGTLYLTSSIRINAANFFRQKKHTAYITVTDLRELELSGSSSAEVKNRLISGGEFELETSGASSSKDFKIQCTNFSADSSGSSSLNLDVQASQKCEIDLSGASKMVLSLGTNCRELDIDVSGASHLNAEGQALKCSLEASGASKINAKDLKTKDCEADASGASGISITVSDRLLAEASGASHVKAFGKPKSVQKSTTGASVVILP